MASEAIPLSPRIFAVIDTYEVMTSDRPYRKALTVGQALEEIRRHSESQFDRKVVEAFFRVIERFQSALLAQRYSAQMDGASVWFWLATHPRQAKSRGLAAGLLGRLPPAPLEVEVHAVALHVDRLLLSHIAEARR